MTTPDDISHRKELARIILESGRSDFDNVELAEKTGIAESQPGPMGLLALEAPIPFPQGLEPRPKALNPKPVPGDALPKADVVVITWTVAELNALADVLTPGVPRTKWHQYNRDFAAKYDHQIRDGAPAKRSRTLGSYYMTEINNKRVLCYKSELHLNQDGVRTGDGTATLPVKDMFQQIIREAQPTHVLTVGTAGGIHLDHDLGDVLVTRGAKFRLQSEFKKEPFADAPPYVSNWQIPTTHFAKAEELMQRFAKNLEEPDFAPPTKRFNFNGGLLKARKNTPSIIHEGGVGANKIKPAHPILSTDFFEFGTSANADELFEIGCGMEMGDAALGLAVEGMPNAPKWAVLRNVSDPQINGDLWRGNKQNRALDMQAHWAVWYYEAYGYHTSVNSALATWAIIAGL